MKQLSGIELSFIVKEMQKLENSRVDKIFNPEREEFIFRVHTPGLGKNMIRIALPSQFYLTSFKKESLHPGGFCMFLRKRLKSSRIRSIKQLGFERIVKIEFETKEETYILIAELFGKGNVILCDKDEIVLSPLQVQKWADRTIQHKLKYQPPEMKPDILNLNADEFKMLIEKGSKPLVKSLATNFGLGGAFSEEIVARLSLDKSISCTELSDENLDLLNQEIKKILSSDLSPVVIEKDGEIVDILPFNLSKYKDYVTKAFESFNEAMDQTLTPRIQEEIKEKVVSKKNKKLNKLQSIIKSQEDTVEKLSKKIDNFQLAADTIYGHYAELTELSEVLSKAMTKYSLAEIKEKVETIPYVKRLDMKTKKLILNFE